MTPVTTEHDNFKRIQMTQINESGAAHELAFWKGFVKTPRFLDGWCGSFKTPELNQEVADFILSVEHKKVLDVGSGVVSILHGLSDKMELTPADPLGDAYSGIFDYNKYVCERPYPVAGEDLAEYFGRKRFDIVHCSNALDHSNDPVKTYENMLALVKKGGYLVVQGFENEGVFENYSGFHQWNLCLLGEDLLLYDKNGRKGMFKSNILAKKIKLDTGKDWFIFIVKKG